MKHQHWWDECRSFVGQPRTLFYLLKQRLSGPHAPKIAARCRQASGAPLWASTGWWCRQWRYMRACPWKADWQCSPSHAYSLYRAVTENKRIVSNGHPIFLSMRIKHHFLIALIALNCSDKAKDRKRNKSFWPYKAGKLSLNCAFSSSNRRPFELHLRKIRGCSNCHRAAICVWLILVRSLGAGSVKWTSSQTRVCL